MNTQHTPGDWHANGTQIVGKNGKRNQYVADIARDNGMETTKANASLIAAAPELLEALEYCVHWLKALSAQKVPVDNDLKRCLDAISKAKGTL